MKEYSLTIALFGSLAVTQAQVYQKIPGTDDNKLVINLPAKNNLAAASSEPLESITLTIRGDTVSSVQYKSSSADDVGGNEYMVHQKRGIQLPFIPDLRIKNTLTHKDQSGKYGIDQVRLFRDSTVYIYTQGYKPHNYPDVAVTYLGDIKELESNILRGMAGFSFDKPIDSVLVYEAIIYELDKPSKARFELNGLVYGKPSQFSHVVESHLTARVTGYFNDGKSKWAPLITGSNIPKSNRIRIEARLNPDASVTIKFPEIQRATATKQLAE